MNRKKILKKIQAYILFWSIFTVFLITDQVSKQWVHTHLGMTEQIEVIENFFWIVHVHNKGAAWGILQGFGWLLSLLALVALIGIFVCRRILQLETNYMQVVFGLLC
ncbi:MAG: signal peptidase II, partial [Opitutae bacterium]|nr:signal peptidase II [Opitutae bacterium]